MNRVYEVGLVSDPLRDQTSANFCITNTTRRPNRQRKNAIVMVADT